MGIAAFLAILLLIAVGFFTLLERKFLAYLMLRKGPNKPSLLGIIVPFADALKLLTKLIVLPSQCSSGLIVFACLLGFLIPCSLWLFAQPPSSFLSFNYCLLSILCWISLSVHSVLSAGWGSNSKYRILGGIRSIAQCVSYEVCLSLILLCFCLFSGFVLFSPSGWVFFLVFLHLVLLLFVIVLAETNRSPFDFAEGESELVSGFNVEYSGSGFVILFLSEYLRILFMSYLVSSLSFSSSFFASVFGCLFFASSFVWARGSLPRFRYDQLMSVC